MQLGCSLDASEADVACGGPDRPGTASLITLLAIPLADAPWGARITRKHPNYWLGWL